jgi:hypothetical protein
MILKFSDKTTTNFITDYEYELPIAKVDIDEFERRLKKLAEPGTDDTLSQLQIIEAFQDHPYLKDINVEDSLIRNILLHDFFLHPKKKGRFHIPLLLLFGNMYCSSSFAVRAQKFFEICQPELNQTITTKDKDLKAYFMRMLEISYKFMMSVYDENAEIEN